MTHSAPYLLGKPELAPMLTDTLRRMRRMGRHALAFATSAFGSYSGCRQYQENVDRARAEIGSGAPEIHKLRTFHNHPAFLKATADRVWAALDQIVPDRRDSVPWCSLRTASRSRWRK